MAVLAERYGRACQNSPDVVNLEQLWGHFGVTLETLWGTLGSLWHLLANFFVKEASSGRPFRPKCAEYTLFQRFSRGVWATLGTLGDHFGVILNVFGTVLSDFGISLS